MSNASVTDPAEIQKGIERAEFVKKEIEALYVWEFLASNLLYISFVFFLFFFFFFSSFNIGRNIYPQTRYQPIGY